MANYMDKTTVATQKRLLLYQKMYQHATNTYSENKRLSFEKEFW